MIINYKSTKLEKLFNSERGLTRKFGARCANIIGQRLYELFAAKNLAQIFLLSGPRCHQLKGRRKGQYSVDVEHPFRLLFKPDNDPIPLKTDKGLDLERVDRIKIIDVVDTHE